MVNEYYVISDLVNNLYLNGDSKLVAFNSAKEFFSKIDAGKFLIEQASRGQYTIITVYRVTEY